MGKLPYELIDAHGKEDSIIISEADPHGIILHVNDNFCATSGYSRVELIGKSHNIIRHPSMPKELFRHLWATIKQGGVFRGVIKNQRKDGSYYWLNSTIVPVFQHGKIVSYIGGRNQITDEKLAERLFLEEMQNFSIGDF